MGVPGFFRELIKRFPKIVINNPSRASHLFIDANCLFHPQCFRILALNPNASDDVLFDKMSDQIMDLDAV